ncbi:unnamed protein product [Bursaphelenchus xylophilus]|uniref:(pine wood nematode) hypothetical protein n=1 Tax=Bursaphelenchus xylophilus TaxID=6326 RepID=A0A1I7SVU7_BURXY|nr:unnamed protein product [Bursaphelenchus xylophilus]CAG9098298.1 unnamed protein product [Bursaphelenchus xylophilus]
MILQGVLLSVLLVLGQSAGIRSGKIVYTPPYGAPPPASTVPPAPVNVIPTTTLAPVDFDCSSKLNGYYSKQPCSSTFYFCNGGHAFQQVCPPGTGYDVVAHQCEYISECGKPKTTTTAAPAPVNVQPTTTPSTECVGRPDGIYERGTCQNSYLHCANGNAYPLACPANLAYKNGTCLYVADCLAPPTTTAAPAPVNVAPPAPIQPAPVVNPYAPPAPPATTAPPAPVNVQPPVPQNPYAPIVPAVPATTVAPSPVNVLPSTTQAPSFNCQGRPDGQYSNTWCGQQFYICYGGVAYQQNCPAGTGYDAGSNTCEWTSECGKPKTTTTTAPPAPVNVQPAPPQPAPVQYGAPPAPVNILPTIPPPAPVTVAPTTAAPSPVSISCAGKADGFYGQGCSAQYTSCAAGNGYAFSCPSGLKYSAQTGSCDWSANIPECGGTLPTTTAAPAPVNVAPVQPVPQVQPVQPTQPVYGQPPVQPAPVQTTTAAPGDNLCANLQNGIYGRRCSRHYFVCSANKTYEFTCPGGYAYDPDSSQCAPKEQVRVCAGLVTTTAVPSPVNVSPQQPFNPYAGY